MGSVSSDTEMSDDAPSPAMTDLETKSPRYMTVALPMYFYELREETGHCYMTLRSLFERRVRLSERCTSTETLRMNGSRYASGLGS